MTLAFTGSLPRHEEEARSTWGGPLCITEHEHTLRRLREIEDELWDTSDELGLEILASNASESRNVVELEVVAIEAATQEKIVNTYRRRMSCLA